MGADGGSESIFGGMFMEAFYTSFDRTNFELGFAPVSSKCGNHLQGSVDAPASDNWIRGCTDPNFAEYDSAANAADPSACVTRFIDGCLDPNYEEYDSTATRDTVPSSCCTCVSSGHCVGQPGEGCAGQADTSSPTLDQLAAACPSEFAACEAAAGCEDALMVALSGGEPDASGPGVAELQALATCLNGQSGGSGGPDSCRYAFDHECDDGSQGGPQYCATGTDTTDCAETAARSALSRGSGFMKQVDLVSTFSAPGNEKLHIIPHQEVCELCEHVVQYVVDRTLQGVCDANAICGHFHGKWKAHCTDLEAALHDSSNTVGTSLCDYVQSAADGETNLMCTELLKVVADVRHQEPPEQC